MVAGYFYIIIKK